jgi:hypothetical protein
MDPVLARRLETDTDFREKIKDLAVDYIKLGRAATEANFCYFDEALDLYNCLSSLSKNDMEELDKGHPKRYILPMSATQAVTAISFLASVLFGENKPHKVEARNPGDEKQSDLMNMLLRWNADQQPFYLINYAWVQDAWLFNRGVIFENWQPVYDVQIEETEMEDPNETEEVEEPVEKGIIGKTVDKIMQLAGEDSQQKTRTVKRQKRYKRYKKIRKESGGYTRMTNVTPYDFICDPELPLYRLNEGRFAGHRMSIPWVELERRSKLPVTDRDHISERAVTKIKDNKSKLDPTGINLMAPKSSKAGGAIVSPSAFARERGLSSGILAVDNTADKQDGGVPEVWVLRVKIAPDDYDIYSGETEKNVWEILISGDEVLALNEDTYIHDEYPYMVGEARPYVHGQFSPSWQMITKPMQDHVDYLKERHESALARTVGNVFVGDPTLFDFDDFNNPEKEGQVLATKRPLADNEDLRKAIMQIPVTDLTGDFWNEVGLVQKFSESTSGANNVLQGEMVKGTATANVAAQKFGTGRMTTLARLLNVQGPMRQTRRVMMNFQEWAPDEMVIRLNGEDMEFRDQFAGQKYVKITRSAIQGGFDVVPVDITLPGTDTIAVAAITKLIESASYLPQLFDETVEGNLSIKNMAKFAAKRAGAPVDNFVITGQQAEKNRLARLQSMLGGMAPQPAPGQPPQSLTDDGGLGAGMNIPTPQPGRIAA